MQNRVLGSRRDILDQADDTAYRFLPVIPRLPSVTAALAYLAPAADRPYNYMYEPPAGIARDNCEYRARSVSIKDLRGLCRKFPGRVCDADGYDGLYPANE